MFDGEREGVPVGVEEEVRVLVGEGDPEFVCDGARLAVGVCDGVSLLEAVWLAGAGDVVTEGSMEALEDLVGDGEDSVGRMMEPLNWEALVRSPKDSNALLMACVSRLGTSRRVLRSAGLTPEAA